MSDTDAIESAALRSACFNLIDGSKTVLLSSYSEQNGAEISYAPYVRDGLDFYIYVSELARHSGNLLASSQGSIMFIQSETEAENLFARERVVFNCRVQEVDRKQALYHRQLQAMKQKFGDIIVVLRTLSDFHLLRLQPCSGQYVAGFGKAYVLDLDSDTFRLQKNAAQQN